MIEKQNSNRYVIPDITYRLLFILNFKFHGQLLNYWLPPNHYRTSCAALKYVSVCRLLDHIRYWYFCCHFGGIDFFSQKTSIWCSIGWLLMSHLAWSHLLVSVTISTYLEITLIILKVSSLIFTYILQIIVTFMLIFWCVLEFEVNELLGFFYNQYDVSYNNGIKIVAGRSDEPSAWQMVLSSDYKDTRNARFHSLLLT